MLATRIAMPAPDTRLPLASRDVSGERLAQLRALCPEAFTEGKLDPAKLSPLFGNGATDVPKRYGLSWMGKSKGVICLDAAFAGNEQLKTNIVLKMKSHGIDFHTA